MVYPWAPWRHAAAYALFGVAVSVVTPPLVSLLLAAPRGRLGHPDPVAWEIFAAVYPVVLVASSLRYARRRPPLLRLTPAGVELAESGRDAVLVPWWAVSSLRVRGFWPFTTVRVCVAVAHAAAVTRVFRGGSPARQRRRNGAICLTVPLFGLAAGRAEIRAAIRRVRPSVPGDPGPTSPTAR